jgi:hypothetical protein
MEQPLVCINEIIVPVVLSGINPKAALHKIQF